MNWKSRLNAQWLEKQLLARRTVLLGLGAAGAAALLPGCNPKKKTPPPPPPANPTLFDRYRTMRDLVRTSPDHLSARAAEVIAAKDFSAAVRFVRDRIGVLPPMHDYDQAIDGVRFGPDAALRAGAGTQRERADLLAAMLAAMGATTTVKQALAPAGLDAAALYASRPPAFSVDASKVQADASLAPLLAHVSQPFPDVDPASVIATLNGLLPSGQAAAVPYDGVDTKVPLVEYTVNGTTRWAFALGTVDEVTQSPAGLVGPLPPVSYSNVTVRLLASVAPLPGVAAPPPLLELATGSWTMDQLAGSRVLITNGAADPDGSVGTPKAQITMRQPVLTVKQSTPLTAADPKLWTPGAVTTPKPAVGPPITSSGAQFVAGVNPGDPPVGPYGAVLQLDSAAHAAALAKVASVQVTANGGGFPDVRLTVTALDAQGAPVFGLGASDFAITDEGAAQRPALLSNAGVEQSRVMLAYDCSGSVTWPMPSDKTAFDAALENALVAAASPNPYLLGTASLGSGTINGYVAPDATAIDSFVSACVSFSELWYTLGQAAPNDGCAAVVMVSDFQASDDPAAIPALQQRAAASGISLALVPVGPAVDQATIDSLVNLCGAVVLDHTASDFQAKLTAFVAGVAAREKAAGYRLAYRVPADQQTNQGTRTAAAAIMASSAISGSASYVVPPAASRGSVGIAGLYLEVTAFGKSVRRWLAGSLLNHFEEPVASVAADFASSEDLLNGLTTIAFEPGSPTTAANAEDLIACALSVEPLQQACAAGKTQKDGLAAGSTIQVYGGTLAALMEPVSLGAGAPVATAQGLKTVVTTEIANAQGFSRHTDVVPDLNLTVAATKDGAAAFAAAMRATIALSLRESQLLGQSAAGALAGASLQYLAPNGDPSTLTGFAAADLTQWSRVFDLYTGWHRLVPTTPSVGAMWVVDPKTGTTVAIWVDGSGGGCASAVANAAIQEALAVLQLYVCYRALQCEGPKAGPFACLGALVATVYAGVAALFAAALLDGISGLDIMLMIIALIGGALPGARGPLGIILTVAAIAQTEMEVYDSLKDNC